MYSPGKQMHDPTSLDVINTVYTSQPLGYGTVYGTADPNHLLYP
jgi:hypothetical protein